MMRAGMHDREQLEAEAALWVETPIELLLKHAAEEWAPFHSRGTFSPPAIADAIARSKERPNLLISVRAPFRQWLIGDPRRLSIMAQPIPHGEFYMYGIASESDRVGTLIANLRLALELVGSDGDQLVSSLESRGQSDRTYFHVLACIPGSR